MKAFPVLKFAFCLLRLNKILCFLKKALASMIAAAAVCAAICCLTDNKKNVKKCISKMKAVM